MKNITYITRENIISIVKGLTSNDIIITDNEVIVELINKYNRTCKNVEYHSRKTLHSEIENRKPSIVFLLFNSEKTIDFINSILPNTVIYTFELSDTDKIINNAVEELESLTD
ncbi:MAG: hypothetical protein IJC02_01975 [Lachnospiraceae bacterium]|nr:hypothetical protein [Lachnospiraceae bacterium]